MLLCPNKKLAPISIAPGGERSEHPIDIAPQRILVLFRLTGRAFSGRAEPIPLSGGVFSVIGIEDSNQGIPDPIRGMCDHSPAPNSSMLGP